MVVVPTPSSQTCVFAILLLMIVAVTKIFILGGHVHVESHENQLIGSNMKPETPTL